MERRTSKQVLDMAKLSIEAVSAEIAGYESRFGVRDLAEHLINSDDIKVPTHLLRAGVYPGHPEYRDIMASARDSAIFRLWSKSKVVYAMDDLMLHYLSQSSISKIPTEVLRNLPHANPYILLPKPDFTNPDTEYYRTHIGVPVGAFVFGRYNDAKQLCSTAEDKREDLGIMFVGFLDIEEHGTILQTLKCTIPLREKTLTVEDVVNETVAKFHFSEDLAEEDHQKLEVWLRTYVTQAFNSLLYVCTDQPDTEVYHSGINRAGKAKKGSTKTRRPRPDDINTVVKIGFRLGPALHSAKTNWDRNNRATESEVTGNRVRPHQRSGHYKTVWTGHGREIPKVTWVKPYWVSTDLLEAGDSPSDVVVRPVRHQAKGAQ